MVSKEKLCINSEIKNENDNINKMCKILINRYENCIDK